MSTTFRRTSPGRSGFTLIELLVVICIIGILVALSTVGIVKAMDSAKTSSTQSMLDAMSGALAQYAQRWGDYPPTMIDELGVKSPNDVNNGIEALVICLSSQKRGGALFKADDQLVNVDGDSATGINKATNSVLGGDDLREWTDHFGNVIFYMHHKDYAKPKSAMTVYRLSKDGGEDVKLTAEQNPATKTFYSADRFQLRSVGRDGKPGTGDDVRAGN